MYLDGALEDGEEGEILGSCYTRRRLGSVLRAERKLAGLSNADKLSELIEEKTGYVKGGEAIRKIEQGRNEPDFSFIVAFCIALYGYKWEQGLIRITRNAMPMPFKNAVADSAFDAMWEMATEQDGNDNERRL